MLQSTYLWFWNNDLKIKCRMAFSTRMLKMRDKFPVILRNNNNAIFYHSLYDALSLSLYLLHLSHKKIFQK